MDGLIALRFQQERHCRSDAVRAHAGRADGGVQPMYQAGLRRMTYERPANRKVERK